MSDALALLLALGAFVGLAVVAMLAVSVLALAIGGPIALLWDLLHRKEN